MPTSLSLLAPPRAFPRASDPPLTPLSPPAPSRCLSAQANKGIKYLNLSVNQLTDEDSKKVLDALERNTTIKEFSAYNNGAVDKTTRKKLRGFKK